MSAARRTLIAANWKMHKTVAESSAFAEQIKNYSKENMEVILIPPFTSIDRVSQTLIDSTTVVGAQDISMYSDGAHTGDISGFMLSDLGCRYVLVGHSERRRDHHETNEIVHQKMMTALRFQMTPILCLGETEQERDNGNTLECIQAQLSALISFYDSEHFPDIVIAYEPVWAIGTGKTASPKDAQKVHVQIRDFLSLVAPKKAQNIRIIYGGSVKPESAKDLISQPDIDGFLVGGASLEISSFFSIIHASKGS